MQQRLEHITATLAQAETCADAADAIDEGMEALYGGMRPLPSKDLLEQTSKAHQEVGANELRFASSLDTYARSGRCAEERGRALDLKLFIEQMNEVAEAVGKVTGQCGEGDSVARPPCDDLQALLDIGTGHELSIAPGTQTGAIAPSYSVSLRSPYIPPWSSSWEEDVRITKPISRGECAIIPKETKGLMLRLHFERVIVVTDPWVGTFGAARGTRIPIWRMEWVPSEYLKEWNICNVDGKITTTVTQRVKQDIPLNFFWRFYPK
jgi:hypothetical protein